jgi:DNA repair exonuclease SbcCD ATPase subunit
MLKPIKLTLNNVCQHVKHELEYKPGITGVTGRNGAGKSNLVTVAQYFAITGKTYDRTKAELLHWDASKGKTEFEFEYAGKHLTLTRAVHSGTVKLVSDDEEVDLRGADANAYMMDALGTDHTTLLQTCWCPQGSLGKILKMTETERLKFFQQLGGVMVADKLSRELKTHMNKLPVHPDRTEKIAELEEEQKTNRDRMQTLRESEAKEQAFLDEHEAVYKEQLVTATLPCSEEHGKKLDETFATLGQLKKKLVEFDEENAEILALPSTPPPSLSHEEVMAKGNEIARKRLVEKLEKLKTKDFEKPIENPEPRVYEEKCSEEKLLIRDLQKKIKAAEAGTCSTCGQQYHGADVESLGKAVREAKDRLSRHSADFARHLAAQRLYDEMGQVKAQIKETEDALAPFDLDAIAEKGRLRLQWDAAQADYARASQSREVILTALNGTEKDIEVAQAQRTVSEEAKKRAQTVVSVYEKRRTGLNIDRNEIAALDARIRAVDEAIQRYHQEQRQRARTELARQLLSKTRDGFHISKAPRLVMSKMLIGLNARIMNYLGAFEVEFSAHVNERFQIICRFPGGKVIPAHLLSGGQSVALAVAMAFALSDLLAGNLPLIVMDEPTVFLDEANVVRLAQVLEKARSLIKRGMFIQVATHEPLIMSSFTRKIEV